MSYASDLDTMAEDIYRYLNFHEIEDFKKSASQVTLPVQNKVYVAS